MSEATFGRMLIHPDFQKIISDLNEKKVHNSKISLAHLIQYDDLLSNSGKIEFLEEKPKFKLDANKGREFLTKFNLCGYDESMIRLSTLEGVGFFFSHSLVLLEDSKYMPLVYLTFHFYTKSRQIADGKNKIEYTSDPPEVASKKQYIKDRNELITKYVPKSSVLLIDGPLVGGQITQHNITMSNKLLDNNIIPIFVVKNSESSLVVDNVAQFKDKFNSDLEWAYKELEIGERSALIQYTDLVGGGDKNKIFTYIKAFKSSPIRVEMHRKAYLYIGEDLEDLLNMILYLVWAQGDPENPQARPIAISEKFAREAFRLLNVDDIISRTGLTLTMNMTRFGW